MKRLRSVLGIVVLAIAVTASAVGIGAGSTLAGSSATPGSLNFEAATAPPAPASPSTTAITAIGFRLTRILAPFLAPRPRKPEQA
jgi:hypothetical protein